MDEDQLRLVREKRAAAWQAYHARMQPATPSHVAQPQVPPHAPVKAKREQKHGQQASDLALNSGLSPRALFTGDDDFSPAANDHGIPQPPVPPATPAGRAAGGSGRFKWTPAETQLLYRLEDVVRELFDSANAARQEQQEDRLTLPTITAQTEALSAVLPDLKPATLQARYAAIRKGNLPCPKLQLSDSYEAAAVAAAEDLLSAAEEADAEGVTRRKRKPAAAAAGAAGGEGRAVRQREEEDAAGSGAAPSRWVGGKIMPGARPENPPGNPRSVGKTRIATLQQARRMKMLAHHQQKELVLMLHDDHELFTWYQCTDQICQWGKKCCIGCGKPRPLKAHSLYSVEWSMVSYPDASGQWNEKQMITIKFMCPGCVLKHDDA